MAHQQSHEALMSIDANIQSSIAQQEKACDPLSDANSKPVPAFAQERQQHQSLHNKLMRQENTRTGQQQGQYVSPSDNILSPASQKLNALKERRFVKQAKPRALFASTKPMSSDGMRENLTSSSNTHPLSMDLNQKEEKDSKMSEG